MVWTGLPANRHGNAAGGLMFYGWFFPRFLISPSHSTTGEWISTRTVALTPSMKNFTWVKIWWTLVKGHCHSNQFCGVKLRQVGMKRLHCLCWHSTTVGKIATTILALTPPSIPLKRKGFPYSLPSFGAELIPVCRKSASGDYKSSTGRRLPPG